MFVHNTLYTVQTNDSQTNLLCSRCWFFTTEFIVVIKHVSHSRAVVFIPNIRPLGGGCLPWPRQGHGEVCCPSGWSLFGRQWWALQFIEGLTQSGFRGLRRRSKPFNSHHLRVSDYALVRNSLRQIAFTLSDVDKCVEIVIFGLSVRSEHTRNCTLLVQRIEHFL